AERSERPATLVTDPFVSRRRVIADVVDIDEHDAARMKAKIAERRLSGPMPLVMHAAATTLDRIARNSGDGERPITFAVPASLRPGSGENGTKFFQTIACVARLALARREIGGPDFASRLHARIEAACSLEASAGRVFLAEAAAKALPFVALRRLLQRNETD